MAGQDAAEKGINNRQNKNTAAMSEGVVQKPLRGWRLGGVLFSLALGLALATIETSITATALVTIGEYFGDSVTVRISSPGGQPTRFAIIFTRLSDGIGREAAVITAYVLFAAFSLGGGLAQTLDQLIALRVLQGIGGSGLYSMLMVIGVEITPVRYWGALSGMIGMSLATGSVLGIRTLHAAIEQSSQCHYRTHTRRCHYGKGIMALDLFVQCSGRCRRNNNHADLLAAKRKDIQTAKHFLAFARTGGLVGCRSTVSRLHAVGLCASRRWKYCILVE
ncbi:MAG: hypothetical protein Q9225_003209 [Loekoesia sp. 1 TL-2023]